MCYILLMYDTTCLNVTNMSNLKSKNSSINKTGIVLATTWLYLDKTKRNLFLQSVAAVYNAVTNGIVKKSYNGELPAERRNWCQCCLTCHFATETRGGTLCYNCAYPKAIYRRNIGDYLRQPYLWVKYRWSSSATIFMGEI